MNNLKIQADIYLIDYYNNLIVLPTAVNEFDIEWWKASFFEDG